VLDRVDQRPVRRVSAHQRRALARRRASCALPRRPRPRRRPNRSQHLQGPVRHLASGRRAVLRDRLAANRPHRHPGRRARPATPGHYQAGPPLPGQPTAPGDRNRGPVGSWSTSCAASLIGWCPNRSTTYKYVRTASATPSGPCSTRSTRRSDGRAQASSTGGPRRTAVPRSPIGDFGSVTQVEVTEGRGTG
jgi:hypothetical protein